MPEPDDRQETDAIVAGTLCLMSCPESAVAPVFVRRIVANLERLASHPAATLEMRTVCRRLARQWEQRLSAPEPHRGPAPLH
ncbi:MAG: hypothetical protein AB7P08_16200 [Burkholderiales bacterium]